MAESDTAPRSGVTSAVRQEVPDLNRSRGDALSDSADRAADRRERIVLYGGRLAIGVLFVLAWELVSGSLWDTFFLSKPSLIAGRLVELAGNGELWKHFRVTMLETLVGMALGLPLGVLLGLLVASSRVVGQWFYPYVIAMYSLPRVALAPLFIVWFGIGLFSKVMMVITMVLFVAFYNVYQGVMSLDEDLLDMARSYRASRSHVLRWVVLPSISPWLLTALRLSVGLALIGAVIAELIGSSAGLGYYIKLSSNLFDTTGVFTGLVVITVVAMLLEQLIGRVERRVLRYR